MEIILGGKPYEVEPLRLKKWVEFESLKSKVHKEAERGNVDGFSDAIVSCVSLSVNLDANKIKDLPWIEVFVAYQKSLGLNKVKIEFPLFSSYVKKKKKVGWDYEERSWYIWAHTLASAFGWHIEYIADLVVEDAIALIEEVYVQEQLDKEWEWSLSEIAYPYNEQTKKKVFKPLPRPEWMTIRFLTEDEIDEVKKTKIPRSLVPVGNVVKAKWLDVKH